MLLSKVIHHSETTPDLSILQPAPAFLSLHNLALKAANVETPIPTATTAHHSSSSNSFLADVNNYNISFACRQIHSVLFVVHSSRSLQTTHLYNNPHRPVCKISRALRNLPSLLNCCSSVIADDCGSGGGACVTTASLRSHQHTLLPALV